MLLHALTPLLSLCLVQAALVKRDVPIGTLTVPLSLSSDRTYTVQINMGPPASAQVFNFSVSTTLGYSIVAGIGCSSCNSSATYDPSKSGSESSLSVSQSVALGNGLAVGHLIKENCSLQQGNGSVWAYPNQTIVQVDSTNSSASDLFSPVANGIFGLGLTGPNLLFPDTVFGGFFHRNPHTNTFQYGMALNPPAAIGSQIGQQSAAGVLHWLQPDQNAYQGNISWGNVVSQIQSVSQTPLSSTTDWTVQVDAWTATASGSALAHNQASLATVEPYFPEIYLPFAEANQIYSLIKNAVSNDLGEFVEWTIPCTTDLTWALSFAGVPFSVPSSSLVIPSGGSCVGAIRGWSDQTQSTYLLGSTFISAIYLIFSVSSSNNTNPNMVGMVQRSSNTSGSGHPLGAIIGGVIGGVALLALIGFGIWFMLRRRQSLPAPLTESHQGKKEAIDPFVTPPPTGGFKRMSPSTFAMADGPAQYAQVPSSPASFNQTHNHSSVTPPASPASPRSAISITQRSMRSGDAMRPSPTPERQDLLHSPTDHMLPRVEHHQAIPMGPNYLVEPLILPASTSNPLNTKAQRFAHIGNLGSPGSDSAPPPEYSSGGVGTTAFSSVERTAQNSSPDVKSGLFS